ncbi:MAG: 1-acyl-sn-glycerol-3-phosphate acyltransferase [Fervidobacterium sp.]|nr:1-acyl-sn-glycerol-3-phosphate acyltransferase [Fervidobacterium sp.]
MKSVINFLRTIWFLVGAFLYIFVYGAVVLLIGFILGKRDGRKFVLRQIEIFGRIAFKLLGVKVYVCGKKPDINRNYIVACNHQSILDIPLVLGYVGPTPFIAKKELGKFPMINLYLKYLGSELIDRGNIRQTALVIREVMKKLNEGYHFVIFPEGTRSPDGEVYPFKPRSLEIAYKSKVPVLPISIWGNHLVIPKHKLTVSGNKVGIYINNLVYPESFPSEEEMRIHVENMIKEGVKKLKEVVSYEKSDC